MSNQKRPEENPALIQALCKLTKILDVKIFKIVEDILIIFFVRSFLKLVYCQDSGHMKQ